jgi:hypothetical protein
MPGETIDDVLTRALDAYATLELLGEEVEDEWTYVTELEAVWRARLTDVSEARHDEIVELPVAAAIERAIAEIASIEDPHRAIDWLSTFPQIVLIALGAPR